MRGLVLFLMVCTAPVAFAQTSAWPFVPTAPGRPSPAQTAPAAGAAPATAPAASIPAVNSGASGVFNGYMPDETYKLRVGDAVSFQITEDRVWNPQDVPKNILVVDSGEVEVP